MKKRGFTIIESLISLLIVSAAGLSAIYIANGYFKNACLRDIRNQELIQNIDVVEKMKATVKTEDELTDFADVYEDVIYTKVTDNLYKIVVGDERKLAVVLKVRAE